MKLEVTVSYHSIHLVLSQKSVMNVYVPALQCIGCYRNRVVQFPVTHK